MLKKLKQELYDYYGMDSLLRDEVCRFLYPLIDSYPSVFEEFCKLEDWTYTLLDCGYNETLFYYAEITLPKAKIIVMNPNYGDGEFCAIIEQGLELNYEQFEAYLSC